MKSDVVFTITDDGEPVITLVYSTASAFPSKCRTVLELTSFLDGRIGNSEKSRYLYTADSIYSVLKKYGALGKLSGDTYDRLRMLSLVYKGMRYEYIRRRKSEQTLYRKCESMLAAALRISSIMKQKSFDEITAGDCAVMKRYLISNMPSKDDLAALPGDMQERLRPFFELLGLLIDISPSKSERAMFDETMNMLYGEKF